ncbi:MAG TPA: (4Fe-4S)-binding protein [Candidatus Kapabacteria bacterium]|nr:(4Fe-4S)-binding protein [Candidatus Kapabacteria bacterium]
MSHFDKSYSNGEITVLWKPEVCIHSGNCARGLPSVFKPRIRPWVQLEHATTGEIITAVEKCPSGALSYTRNPQAEKL